MGSTRACFYLARPVNLPRGLAASVFFVSLSKMYMYRIDLYQIFTTGSIWMGADNRLDLRFAIAEATLLW